MDCCNLFLFDSKSELPGGTGKTFNWELLKRYKLKKEFFISGGIGLDSINSLKELVQMNLPLYGIDVNSKFEDESNLKVIEDLIKFKEIIDNEI
jgi:phosphoribosylanthranilate isomerase